jgi:hypothetical protein
MRTPFRINQLIANARLRLPLISSHTAIRLGITKRVNIVENKRPKRITFASGDHISNTPLIPNAIGTKPEMVVSDVNIIGRNRNHLSLTIFHHLQSESYSEFFHPTFVIKLRFHRESVVVCPDQGGGFWFAYPN